MDDPEANPLVPQLRLDELLAELQVRLQDILDARDRTHTLLEAVVAVGAHLDLEVVLRRIVEAAVSLAAARYGALGVIGEGGSLVEFVPVGLDESEIGTIDRWPEGRGLLGELIAHPGTLASRILSADTRSSGFPDGHPPMRSFLGTPVRIRDEDIYGNLYLTGKPGRRRVRRGRRGPAGGAGRCGRGGDRERPAVCGGAQAAAVAARANPCSRVRRLVRPGRDEGAGHRGRDDRVPGFAPSVRMEERLDAPVPAKTAEHVLAVLREALSNAAGHRGAARVSVAVRVGPDLTLTVRDDGSGMKASGRRSGLGNLADRAGELGGTLNVGPAEGGGTELEWRVRYPGAIRPASSLPERVTRACGSPAADPVRGDADGMLTLPARPRFNASLHGLVMPGQEIHVVRRAMDEHAPPLAGDLVDGVNLKRHVVLGARYAVRGSRRRGCIPRCGTRWLRPASGS